MNNEQVDFIYKNKRILNSESWEQFDLLLIP